MRALVQRPLKPMEIHRRKVVIAFDDIDGVPDVYVDGEQVSALVDIIVDWHTKTDQPMNRSFKLCHYRLRGEGEPVLDMIRQPEEP